MNQPQLDLFAAEAAPTPASPPVYRADPAVVRGKIQAILAEARSAETMPWSPERLVYLSTVVPQMANWLPDEEAEAVRLAFAAEVERLSSG